MYDYDIYYDQETDTYSLHVISYLDEESTPEEYEKSHDDLPF